MTALCVAYRPDVFSAAQRTPPVPDWTVKDFDAARARIWALAQAGKIPACYGPLPAVTSNATHYNPALRAYTETLPPTSPALRPGFAAGYGGTFIGGGRFDLTGTGTAAGLGEMVRSWRAYGRRPGRRARWCGSVARHSPRRSCVGAQDGAGSAGVPLERVATARPRAHAPGPWAGSTQS